MYEACGKHSTMIEAAKMYKNKFFKKKKTSGRCEKASF